MLGDATVELAFADFPVSDEIPGTSREEAKGNDAVGISGEEDVAGDLLLYEAGEGLVLIEAADDVVAIGPGIGAWLVFVIAVRLGVAGEVEPVLGELFAEGGRGEEPVGEVADGGFWILDRFGFEGGDFFG